MSRLPRADLWACAATLALLLYLLARATGGLEHWTFESLRRARAAEGRLQAPDVTLVDSQGQTLRPWRGSPAGGAQAARGKVLIVDFVFTRCATVCLSLGTAFQQMQAQLTGPAQRSDAPGIELLSVSFDTAHDGPEALQAYALRHRADPARWAVAVPSSAAGNQALLRALGVVVIPDGAGGYTHNAGLHVIDVSGRLAGLYELDEWPRALDHARSLAASPAP